MRPSCLKKDSEKKIIKALGLILQYRSSNNNIFKDNPRINLLTIDLSPKPKLRSLLSQID